MSFRYRSIEAEIEAFQMTRERRQDRSTWPVWLVEAAAKPRTQVGAIYVKDPQAPNAPDLLRLVSPAGVLLVNFGDWLVFNAAGDLALWAPAVFEQTYEPVPD